MMEVEGVWVAFCSQVHEPRQDIQPYGTSSVFSRGPRKENRTELLPMFSARDPGRGTQNQEAAR